jgi:hypothetical protein
MLKTIEARWREIYFIIQTSNPLALKEIFAKHTGIVYEDEGQIKWLFKRQATLEVTGIPFEVIKKRANLIGIDDVTKNGFNSARIFFPSYEDVDVFKLMMKKENNYVKTEISETYIVNLEKYCKSMIIEDESQELKDLFNDISKCDGTKNIFHNRK